MAYLWTFTIDFGIFLVLYKFRLAVFFMHVVISLGVALFSLITVFPMLQSFGIPET
jgi:hypothetical protein